jgi:hypothetical protein
MIDGYQDDPPFLDERDLVGDPSAAAGYHAADADYLYLRLRVDGDPAPGGALSPFGWGIELDTDGDTSTYEVLIMASGLSGQVILYRNSATTLANNPNDPADLPPVAAYGFQTNGLSVVAPGSAYGGNGDYFVEMAVPWSDLALVGVFPTTRVRVWAGSSTTDDSLDGDLACHGAGAATLSGLASDPTVPDPGIDSDGDGFPDAVEVTAGTNPNDPNSHPAGPSSTIVYEGGGGCSIGGPVARLTDLLVLGLALLPLRLLRRRGILRR